MNYIDQAYDPEDFRRQGHQLVDYLADHLLRARSGEVDRPVMPLRTPAEQLAFWKNVGEQTDWLAVIDRIARESTMLHHPGYIGHQVTPPAPLAALTGLAGELLNNGMAVYEMGAAASALEQILIQKTAAYMGFGERAGGFLTSGGTVANLTAMLTARQAQIKDAWTQGTEPKWAIMVSAEAHYCISRAVKIMGWGEEGLIPLAVDEHYRVRVDLLEQQYRAAQAKGRTVIALVGSAGTTSTGSYDNLHALADFCGQHGLWFHVDGAHGAAVAFSEKYRDLISGIERADSMVLDFHKMLMVPALATAVIYKEGAHSYATFTQQAEYLLRQTDAEEWYNLGRRTLECTKFMISAKIYSLWNAYGVALFDEYVSRQYDLARAFADLIQQYEAFETAVYPESNIVCFRHYVQGEDEESANARNLALRHAILQEGDFYLVQTRLQGKVYLRTTLMNPFTTLEDLARLLKAVLRLAATTTVPAR